ncbi:MAG: hypothetical protein M3619_32880, partial [Myxococcota bacterium]|nr:hypothetical protein [Myxococcota bacterium]
DAPTAPPPPGTSVAVSTGVQSVLPNLMSTALGGTLDFNLDYTHFSDDDAFFSEITIFGFRAHGQYISPKGYGGYLTLPGFYASIDGGSEGGVDSQNGVGNIEIGGLYVMRQGPSTDLMLRGGLALDTAGQVASFFGPFSHIVPRLADAYQTGFSTTWGRAGASVRHTAGSIVIGAAAGFDVPFSSGDGEDGFSLGIDALASLVGSIGFTQGEFGAAAGVVLLQAIGTDDDNTNLLGANANLDFSVGPNSRMYVLLGLSLEEEANEAFSVGIGFRHAIH